LGHIGDTDVKDNSTPKVKLMDKRFLLLAISASLILAGPPIMTPAVFAADNARLVELNNEGVRALNNNNYQLAIQKFEEALKLDSNYAKAKENLAIAYNNYGLSLQGNAKEAIKLFHKALYLSPGNSTSINNLDGIIGYLGKNPNSAKDRIALGDAARLAGDFQGAVVEYEAAGRIQADPKTFSKLGDVYRVLGDSDKSVQAYQSASRSGDSADIQVKLGQAFQAKKDLSSALAAYDKALRLKPDDPDVLDALVAGWEEALRADPMSASNHIGLGQALQYRGDFDQAAAEYQQALRFDKQNALANRLLGELDSAKKRATLQKHINAGVDLQTRQLFDQALEEYKKALEMDPRNANVYVNIGTVYQTREDFEKAQESYNKALAIDPNSVPAQQGLKAAQDQLQLKKIANDVKEALDLYKAGRFDEAIHKYDALLRINPKDPVAHFNLGAAYQAKKDIDQAIAAYKQALNFDAKNDDYKKALDTAYELKAQPIEEAAEKKHTAKDYRGAIELYNQALTIRPKNAAWWYNLAGAQYAFEDYPSAKESYKKALELDPQGQADNAYRIAIIDEHMGAGALALAAYRKYAAEHSSGQFVSQAKERMKALSANIQDTVKIKGEHELAMIKDAEDSYHKAVDLTKEKKFDEAQALFQKAISLQPKEAAYISGLGAMYQEKGEVDEAIKYYQQAGTLDTKNAVYKTLLEQAFVLKAQPLVDQAYQKFKANDYTGAIDLYRQALLILPNKASLWTNLGAAYQASDDFFRARDAYQKAVQLDVKGEVEDEFQIAVINEHYKQGAEALAMYKKYIADSPGGANADPARKRIQALTANLGETQKLLTMGEKDTLKQINEAYDQALSLQQQGKYDEALPLYKKVVELAPRDAGYAYSLGTLYQAKGDLANAGMWYEKAIALDPKNADYKQVLNTATSLKAQPLIEEAEKKHAAGDLTGAIELYQKGLAITPNDAHTWSNFAGALQGNDDFGGARGAYSKAVELNPKGEVESFYYLAALDEHFNQGQKALTEYQRYVQASPRGSNVALAQARIKELTLNPSKVERIPTSKERQQQADAGSAYQEAVQLQQASNYDKAIEKYKQAIAVQPNEVSYWYSIGTCYQAKGDIDLAIEAYSKAAQLSPKDKQYSDLIVQLKAGKAGTFLDEAIVKHTAGDFAGSIDLYRKSLEVTPNAARTWSNMAGAYSAMDKFSEARGAYQKAVDLDPKGEADSWFYLASLDENFNMGPKAMQEYQKYLQLSPNGNSAQYARERVKALTANPAAVQRMQTSAEKAKVGEARAAFDKAVQLQTDGRLDEAIAEYKKAIAVDANDASVWYSMATAYQAKGDLDEALNNYVKASQLNPKEPTYKQYATQIRQMKADPFIKSAYDKQTTGNDLDGAIADYLKAISLYDDASSHFSLATAYQGKNDLAKAMGEYRKALQMDPKQVEAYYYLGSIYEALNQPALAVGEYRKYVQAAPNGQNANDAKERIKQLASVK